MEDTKIISLYWSRSERAIRETADKYGHYCNTIAMNILHDPMDAEECVNDTYLNAWNAMPDLWPENLRAFLGKVTRNLSVDRYRLSRTVKRGGGEAAAALSELEECVAASCNIEETIDEMYLAECINHFLQNTSQEKRNIFIYRYWYVYSVPEIAKMIHRSERYVSVTLFRLRKKLKESLEKDGVFV